MFKQIKLLCQVGIIVALCAADSLQAAVITWESAAPIAADTDVNTEGTLVAARNIRAGGTGAVNPIVNGVQFIDESGVALVGFVSTNDTDFSPAGTNGLAIDEILKSFNWVEPQYCVFGTDLLVPGNEYLIQLFFSDNRRTTGTNMQGLAADDAFTNASDCMDPTGEYIIGTFTADDVNLTQWGYMCGGGRFHLNAYQIRELMSDPIPTLSTTAGNPVSGNFTVDIDFTEAVTGLEESDFSVVNGTVEASSLSGSGASWSVVIVPTANGEDVSVTLGAGSVIDGDSNPNPESNTLVTTYLSPGSDQPIPMLSTAITVIEAPYTVQIDFTEAVTGLELSDFVISNGTLSDLAGSGASYSVLVTPGSGTEVTLVLPAGSVTDTDGDNLQNPASNELVNSVYRPDYYVATTGSDTNDGTIGSPFLTLEKAKTVVRAALPTATEPITVWVRGGTYYFDQALEFGPDDSGTASVPVTYSGYANETVVLSGAIPLTPTWSTYSGNIQVATIGTGLEFDILFADGSQQVMARYPNYNANTAILNGYASDAISDARAAGWSNPSTGFVRGLHGSMWGGNSFKITGMSGGSITRSWVGDNNRGSGLHATYRMVENIFEELDAPGEWFYNETQGKLYFYPPSGLNPSTATFDAASLEELIRVVGTSGVKVKHLTFSNFTFTGTRRTLFTRSYEPLQRSDWHVARAGTIFLQDTENVTISNSIISHVGGNGIFISAYNRDHLITNNEFLENGATCVMVVGDPSALRNTNTWDDYVTSIAEMDTTPGPLTDDYPKDITISYNHMQDMGRFEKQTSGVSLSMSESITISHNTIHGCPRAGLNVCDGTWGGHLFEYNDVFDCVRETGDHGPWNSWGRDRFYSIGGYNHSGSDGDIKRPYAFLDAWKTTVIRNNRIHYDEPTSYGIDLDDGSSNFEIYNNLLLNTDLKLREGFDRLVYNNIIINKQAEFHVWYDVCRDTYINNIVINSDAYNTRWISSSDAAAHEATLDYNLFYNGGDDVTVGDSGWLSAGWDVHSVIANPMFVNPATMDYSVQPGSPALTLGFVNFTMDQFGKPGAPQPDPIDYVQGPPPTSDGEPLMGATIASINDMSIQSVLGTPDWNGVYFESLTAGSYAADQGFQESDAIRDVNGTDITTKQSFWEIYQTIEPGATVSITLWRNQAPEPFTFVKMTGVEEHNQTAGAVFTGTWATQDNISSFNDDIEYTQTAGDYFELTFYGAGVAFTSQINSDMGLVDVYIDDILDQTINCYNATRVHQQTVYSNRELTRGHHTLKAVNAEDKYMILDSITVFADSPPDISISDDVVFTTSQSDAETPPSFSTDDLAQTQYSGSSATGGDEVADDDERVQLFNGDIGNTDDDIDDSGEVRMDSDNTFTIEFDTSVNTSGYDITQIDSIFGWDIASGGRSNQGYEIIVTFIDNTSLSLAGPEHWEDNSPTAYYWTTVSFTDGSGGTLACGAKAITFDITENSNAGDGVVVGREIDIFGVPTVTYAAADINKDGSVNLIDFARLASWWADDQCQTTAGCDGADIINNGEVDLNDLKVIAEQWLNGN